jgi:hypothetical protein
MPALARHGAPKGRLRPSFFFLWLGVGLACAQQPVFRCGQQYTNAPVDETRCERLPVQGVTVVPGTRTQALAQTPVAVPASGGNASAPQSVATSGATQKQRDDMARSIVSAELAQAQQRHADLQNEYRQGLAQPQPAAQARQTPLKEALERSQRDIDSLQRELARRPLSTAP